jgi:hypothetical protein
MANSDVKYYRPEYEDYLKADQELNLEGQRTCQMLFVGV